MSKSNDRDRFAYDFEQPVLKIEKQIQDLTDKAATGEEDLFERIAELEKERDQLLQEMVANLTAYQRVRLARHPLRPHPSDYIQGIFGDFTELHGDRRFGDDAAIIAGLGRLGERRVVVIGMRKGKETRQKMAVNFGMPQPEGYRKALHKMKLAEKFGLPVVCLIDTPGAAPAVEAEERGQAMAIAENIYAMAGLRAPIVILVTGEGCSGGALGIGVGDRFAMLENAYYSVISPEGCAAILWKDGQKAEDAAKALKLTAQDMLDAGIIDRIVEEPPGGAHRDPAEAMRGVDRYLTETLDELAAIPVEDLLEQRYARYRRVGVFRTEPPTDDADTKEVDPEPAESATDTSASD